MPEREAPICPNGEAPMSAVGFRRMVERLGETPKMSFPSHPHMLRHST